MADLYQHIPLSSPHSIRVLKLQPSNDHDSPIIIDLEEVSIKTMRHIRDKSQIDLYWIDSICIDQTSLSERSQQVTLMGQIYRDAYVVIAWVGESDPATEGAINCLKSLMDVGSMNVLHEDAVRRTLLQKAETLVQEKKAGREDRIGPLFKRPWFTRLWTVQEITLPGMHKVQVVCGKNVISWTSLMGATESLQLSGYHWGNYNDAIQPQKDLTMYIQQHLHLENRIMLEQKPGYNMHTPSVTHILSWTRSKDATEPKDKVFGLLGIFSVLGIDNFVPDYTQPVEEIYKQVAVMAISHDKNLAILLEATSDNRRPGLNSWVPDWSDGGYKGTDMRGAITDGHFCAGSADPIYHFSTAYNHLHLRGRLFDTVIYRAETMNMRCVNEIDAIIRSLRDKPRRPSGGNIMDSPQDVIRQLHGAFQIMRAWVDVSTWYAGYPARGETLKTALKRTLLYDDAEENGKARRDAAFESWYHIMTTSEDRLNTMAWGASRASNSTAVAALEEARALKIISTTDIGGYFFPAMVFSNRKCLFTTERGYMGTAPDLIRDGDRIAVVAGVIMPLVVRPTGQGGFRLVTHAYVHGIMHGEAWEGDRNEGDVEEIVLV